MCENCKKSGGTHQCTSDTKVKTKEKKEKEKKVILGETVAKAAKEGWFS
jgi:hypothetical protein